MPAMHQRFRILVLDADASNRRLVALVLRSAGHEVLEAELAAEAGVLCAAVCVDLVVAQAALPGLDALTASPGAPPLILMTPTLSGELRDRMRTLGAVCAVHRPVFVDELRGAVTRTLAAAPRRPRPALRRVDETLTTA